MGGPRCPSAGSVAEPWWGGMRRSEGQRAADPRHKECTAAQASGGAERATLGDLRAGGGVLSYKDAGRTGALDGGARGPTGGLGTDTRTTQQLPDLT
ncbi:unnamed protein product [Closterium sp. NIES-53]